MTYNLTVLVFVIVILVLGVSSWIRYWKHGRFRSPRQNWLSLVTILLAFLTVVVVHHWPGSVLVLFFALGLIASSVLTFLAMAKR